MKTLRLKEIVMIVLAVLLLVIIFQNTQVLSLQVLLWKISMSRIIFIPLVLAIGFFIGFFVGRGRWRW